MFDEDGPKLLRTIAVVLLGGLVSGLFGYPAYRLIHDAQNPAPAADPRGCYTDEGDRTVVLLDMTDGYSSDQQRFARQTLTSVMGNLSEGERLALYAMRAGVTMKAVPTWNKCTPKMVFDDMKAQVASERHAYESRATDLIATTLREEYRRTDSSSGYTPLIEHLSQIAATDLKAGVAGRRRLVIFSPFIQHSAGFSFSSMHREAYRRNSDFEVYRKSVYANDYPIDLTNVAVEAYQMKTSVQTGYEGGRPGISYAPWQDLQELFWRNLLRASGAAPFKFASHHLR